MIIIKNIAAASTSAARRLLQKLLHVEKHYKHAPCSIYRSVWILCAVNHAAWFYIVEVLVGEWFIHNSLRARCRWMHSLAAAALRLWDARNRWCSNGEPPVKCPQARGLTPRAVGHPMDANWVNQCLSRRYQLCSWYCGVCVCVEFMQLIHTIKFFAISAKAGHIYHHDFLVQFKFYFKPSFIDD